MSDLTLVIGNKNYSSWSLRPWLVLGWLREHHGVEFREERIALFEPGYRERILAHTPSGRVPVLLHQGQSIWDSLAICETLAELYPQARLWPEDRRLRARARSVSAEMHSGFAVLRDRMPMNIRRVGIEVARTPELERDIARVQEIWRDCRELATDGPFLFGHFTIADAMYAPVVSRFVTYGVECPDVVGEYRDTIVGMPAMQEWMAAARRETEIIAEDEVEPLSP